MVWLSKRVKVLIGLFILVNGLHLHLADALIQNNLQMPLTGDQLSY